MVVLFVEASKPNASPLYGVAGILFTVVFFVTTGDSLRRILIRENFKQRIAQHITDGKVLHKNWASYETSDEYERVAKDWVNKVVSDIRKYRGQSEAHLFLVQWDTNQSVSRDRTHNMLDSCIGWLEWLQMRL